MDPRTFDTIVKALSEPRSRRSVVAGVLGTVLFTLTELADTALGKNGGKRRGKSKRRGAKHDKQRNEKHKDRKRTKGQAGQEICIELGQRCSKHGERCCAGAKCRTLLGLPLIPGRCRCPEGTRQCAGGCIPASNCCADSECDAEEICQDGVCGPPAPCDVCASGCPHSTVQDAVAAANPGDTITICAGTYTENVTIAKDLTLSGTGDGSGSGDTILQGTGTGSVVMIAAGQTVALQQLRVTGGSADSGGGILNLGGTLSLSGCTVSGNRGGFGGGIDNEDGALTVSDSTVSGNTATQLGGGLFVDGASTVTLTNSIVSDNTAGQEGGGIATDDDVVTLTLANCTVSGNISGLGGGGIFSVGNVTLTGSTVRDNTANDDGFGIHGDGGGILNSVAGALTLEASTVTGNHAAVDGGGIANAGTVACRADSTVSGNTAGMAGTENCFDDLALGGSGCTTCPA